jgi:tetratricopeptide (TPR) repeat protein
VSSRRVLALAFGLLLAAPALACINETGTNRFGKPVPVEVTPEVLVPVLTYGAERAELVEWARRVVADARRNPNFDTRNQLAVALIRLGRPRQAIELLMALEQGYPGRYPTATNLGTAYELAGDDAKALEWIREGIRRNADSHDGSEWLHARVLEAKIARTVERGASLLGLDYGRAAMPAAPAQLPAGNDGTPLKPDELSWHFYAQLAERTDFVPAPDPVVARLFFDWGNNEMLSGALETAEVAYGFALKYGHPERGLILARRKEISRILAEHGKRQEW